MSTSILEEDTTIENSVDEIIDINTEDNIEEIVNAVDEVENISETEIAAPTVKRGKGRPQIYGFAARSYLLKKEVSLAMSDKEAFIKLLNESHSLDDARKQELGNIANPSDELSFTIYGEVRTVISELHKLKAIYGDKVTINISKSRLVPPSSKLYKPPATKTVIRNGKEIKEKIHEEYSNQNIYAYALIKL